MHEDPEILRMQRERIRLMSTEERAALVAGLYRAAETFAAAGIRDARPNATDREVFLRLVIRRLGLATARSLYPEIERLEGILR
jgi:hypothetical protein